MRLACLTCALLSLFFAVSAQPPDFELIRKDLEKVDSLIFTNNQRQVYSLMTALRQKMLSKEGQLLLDLYEVRIDFHNRKLDKGPGKLQTLKSSVDGVNDPYLIGNWWLAKGVYHFRAREDDSTLVSSDEAIAWLEQTELPRNLPLIFALRQQVLTSHWRLNKEDEALRYVRRMLKYLDSCCEESVYHVDAYYSMGSIHNTRAETSRARIFIRKAITIARRTGWTEMENDGYVVLGNIQFSDRKYSSAIPYYLMAIERTRQLSGADAFSLIDYYHNLAYMYSQVGDSSACFQTLHVLRRLTLQHSARDPYKNVKLVSLMGSSFLTFGMLDSAAHYTRQSIELTRVFFGNEHLETAWAYNDMAAVYNKRQMYDSAVFYMQQALIAAIPEFNNAETQSGPSIDQLAGKNPLFHLLARKLEYMVSSLRSGGEAQLAAAKVHFKTLDLLLFDSRRRITGEMSQIILTEDMRRFYELGLDLYFPTVDVEGLSDQSLARCYEIFQKSKAIALQAQNLRKNISDPRDLKERNLEKNIQRRLIEIESEMNRIGLLDSLVDKEITLLAELDALSAKPPGFSDHVSDFTAIESAMDEERLEDLLQKSKSKFVEYYWGKENCYLLLWDGQNISMRRIPVDANLRNNILLFREMLVNVTEPAALFQRVSNDLFNDLLGNDFLAGGSPYDELLIIPDGPLAYLPFEALTESKVEEPTFSNLNYLIRSQNIRYDYSSQLAFSHYEPSLIENENILALGSYEESDPSGRQLPGTKRELDAISAVWKGKYLYSASTGDLIDNIERHEVIHLAVHGGADTENLYGSYLEFAGGGQNSNKLYASELYDADLSKIKMTVLSACETGFGRIVFGEGVFSMARAFMYAGCNTVLQSGWIADDFSTTKIIARFYKLLEEGQTASRALRNAKLSFLSESDEKIAHPGRWAVMFYYGREVQRKNQTGWFYALALIPITLLVLFRVKSQKK